MRLFKTQVSCPNCGKLAKKQITRYWDKEPYRGNLIVIRDLSFTRSIRCEETDDLIEVKNYDLRLWDGETYQMYCGHFCTNRCAQQFANDVVNAGFRFTDVEEEGAAQ